MLPFHWRKFCLQLVGDRLRDLALNHENVCQITIVSLRPQMRVIACIDQLRVAPEPDCRRAEHYLPPHVRRLVLAPILRRLRATPLLYCITKCG